MHQTTKISTELNQLPASSPESGSAISDMGKSTELEIEVESLAHENHEDPLVLSECEHKLIFNILNLSKPDEFFIGFISDQPSSSQEPNLKIYKKENNVKTCTPTEDSGKDEVIFSGKVEIISNEKFVSKITQKILRLEKIQNGINIPDYVHQNIGKAKSLLKMDLNCKAISNCIKN
ncbi:hypothetical protein O181_018564 [Austropuccinia psidii MF-1]|uniref:Uncharacterized protein n=1 Tax=Austropuccinia psidii MF-1 TaxID=1389203 RepID=A0A9Q3C7X2_9BASI|nr:hypothetical protein [Austropuccinia psidii MF-1]